MRHTINIVNKYNIESDDMSEVGLIVRDLADHQRSALTNVWGDCSLHAVLAKTEVSLCDVVDDVETETFRAVSEYTYTMKYGMLFRHIAERTNYTPDGEHFVFKDEE